MVIGTMLAGKLIDELGYRWIFPTASSMMLVGLIILQFTSPRQETATAGSAL